MRLRRDEGRDGGDEIRDEETKKMVATRRRRRWWRRGDEEDGGDGETRRLATRPGTRAEQ
jgi:hypothetical protein